jgi:hypothetical protein
MNALVPPVAAASPAASYEASRLNALQHGVLSRHAVLPWESRDEYQSLLEAFVAEHLPQGPTEEHLIEELAGIVWRKRRLRLAEAAIFRQNLRKDAAGAFDLDQVAGAALLPITGRLKASVDIPHALAATAADTARDLREVKRDQSMSRSAESILAAGDQALTSRPWQPYKTTRVRTG